jgi:hypothetical protein
MDLPQLELLSNEIQALHRPMKNIIQIVFAVSPLLALSPHGWGPTRSIHGVYLLRVSFVLVGFQEVLNCHQDVSGSG